MEEAVEASADPAAWRFDVAAELGSTAAIKEGVLRGLGAAFVSPLAVAREAAAGLLATIPVNGLHLKRRFHLVVAPRRARSPLCAAFVEHLVRGSGE